MTDNRPTDTAALRGTYCAWCYERLETDQPWRPDEYQIHRDCVPAFDEYREGLRLAMRGMLNAK